MTLTIVTAADERYWRCLWQFLRDIERHRFQHSARVRVGDLGLAPATRERLAGRFPWCDFFTFNFAIYPPHVSRLANFAWKPLAIAEAFAKSEGDLLWVDSATLFHSSLDEFLRELSLRGLYVLFGRSRIKDRTDARTLSRLEVEPEIMESPLLVGGVVGFSGGSPAAASLLAEWRGLALMPEVIDPEPPHRPSHEFDQALLSILAHRRMRRREIGQPAGAIDISAADPVRWLSSRNLVHPRVPTCADPLVRIHYRVWKCSDRLVIRFKGSWKPESFPPTVPEEP